MLFTEFYYDIILNKIITSIVIFFIGVILGGIFGKLTKKILHEINFNRITTRIFRLNLVRPISVGVTYTIYAITIIIVLNRLKITNFVGKSLLLFIIIIISIELLLNLKEFIPNIYNGIKLRNILKIGQEINTDILKGKVIKISLMNTIIVSEKGDKLYFQNYNLRNKLLKN